jgi:hypothetical protein
LLIRFLAIRFRIGIIHVAAKRWLSCQSFQFGIIHIAAKREAAIIV